MKISRIFFFFNFLEKFLCNFFVIYCLEKKINFEMFFRKEFFSVNLKKKKFFLGTLLK